MKCFAPASALVLAAALLAATDALSIQSSDVVASSSADAHQKLEKVWTVSSAEQLRSLLVQIPGNVFVEYDPSLKASSRDVVAKIIVRSDKTELLDVFEVIPRGDWSHHSTEVREDSVKVHLKNTDAVVQGHVFTQVFVADKSALHDLSAASTHDVVIGEDVLTVNNADVSLKLSTAGAGNMFLVSQEAFAVGALKISVAGSGDVQFSASSLNVKSDTRLSIAGSGDIALLAHDVRGETLKTDVSGSGAIFVQADNVSVDDLVSSIAGSGHVTLANSGTCMKHKVRIAGSGAVTAGSIVCQDTDVSITGSGDVVVQSTESLDVSVIASGSVKYVNARPKVVRESSVFAHHEYVMPAATNTFKTYKTVQIPTRAAVLLDIKLRARQHNEDPSVSISIEMPDAASFVSATSFAALTPKVSGDISSVVPVVGVVGVALAAVGALARKFRQQRKHEEYAPLV